MAAWLIERPGSGAPIYLCADEYEFAWTADHDAALQYPTERAAREAWAAAQSLDENLERMRSVHITEHEWL